MREIYACVWRAFWDCLLEEEPVILTKALYRVSLFIEEEPLLTCMLVVL